MKYLKLILLLGLLSFGLFACSKDDGTHKVKFVVEGGATDSEIRVYGALTGHGWETIRGRFEYTVVTDAEFVRIEATCDDPKNWIKAEIYVNDKLKAQVYGTRDVRTPEIQLK